MLHRFQTWLNRQSLAVKVAITVPLLLAGVLWSIWPSDAGPAVDLSSRPVLGRDAASPDGSSTALSPAGGAKSESTMGSPAPVATNAPVLAPHQEPRPAESTFTWATALRTLVSVVVVIALIVITARVLKYVMASAGQPVASGAEIKVLETVHVPAPSGRGRAAMHLVEVADRLLLVGATDSQMTLLSEFDRGAPPAANPTLALPAPAPDLAAIRPAGTTAHPNGNGVFGGGSSSHPAGFHELLAIAAVNGTKAAATTSSSFPAPPPARNLKAPAATNDDVSFGQAELAAMLRRLRESKTRLQSDN